MTEQEERELLLEGIIHTLHNMIMNNVNPVLRMVIDDSIIGEVFDHLYNEAEIRVDIEDYIDLQIEFEEDE